MLPGTAEQGRRKSGADRGLFLSDSGNSSAENNARDPQTASAEATHVTQRALIFAPEARNTRSTGRRPVLLAS